jgi:hypothetical protein
MNYDIVYGLIMGSLMTSIGVMIFKFWPRKEEAVDRSYSLFRTDVNGIDSAMRSFSDELWDRRVDGAYRDVNAIRAFWWLTHMYWFDYDDGSAMLDFFPGTYVCRFENVDDFVRWNNRGAYRHCTAVEYDDFYNDTKYVYVFWGAWE